MEVCPRNMTKEERDSKFALDENLKKCSACNCPYLKYEDGMYLCTCETKGE